MLEYSTEFFLKCQMTLRKQKSRAKLTWNLIKNKVQKIVSSNEASNMRKKHKSEIGLELN